MSSIPGYLRDCRETYAAEEAVQKLEKEQQGRDTLIEHLQGQIEGQQRQVADLTARRAAQRAKTTAARVRYR